MTIQQIYELAIQMGIKADPRPAPHIKNLLKKEKERFEELKKEEKEIYDEERLRNPYTDTRILTGDTQVEVKRILAGIDIETGEILLSQFLSRHRSKPIDLILAHHPDGKALAGLDEVMHLQADLLASYGVPINVAESLLEKRVSEVSRSLSPINHNQPVDAARLLGLNYICIHTPSDNLAYDFLKRKFNQAKGKLETVEDVLSFLRQISEYKKAAKLNAGPRIFTGSEKRRTGKIALTEVTGGTEGSKHIYEWMAKVGIGTLVGMHMKEENREEAEKHHINVVIAGHMASDSLGLNLFLDELERRGIEIIPCSGLLRVKRFKKKN